MKAKLNSLKAFDFDKANIHLWVFKKTSTAKKYIAYYIQTDGNLSILLKTICKSEMKRISEVMSLWTLN